MKIRESFEEWIQTTQGWKTCKRRGKPFSLRKHINGDYADFRVNDRWHAYRAAWGDSRESLCVYSEHKWIDDLIGKCQWCHQCYQVRGLEMTEKSKVPDADNPDTTEVTEKVR